MPIAFDGTFAPNTLPMMKCGGTPVFDQESGYAYRCDYCFAVIGSVSQPDRCKEINENGGNDVS
ncbi:hypothetical protein [Ralstonia phage RSP15]|uniref:hypothetical protein n=1 Tax=Ralstonia phage RSP15 TaxID=1785960 RepID=UPI00074D327E|nr:hypothetical protein BH754_gp144 [Ralstonia phage RSP15]BAU40162.1 hypothetical protein [Ralstonia phage RSP15]